MLVLVHWLGGVLILFAGRWIVDWRRVCSGACIGCCTWSHGLEGHWLHSRSSLPGIWCLHVEKVRRQISQWDYIRGLVSSEWQVAVQMLRVKTILSVWISNPQASDLDATSIENNRFLRTLKKYAACQLIWRSCYRKIRLVQLSTVDSGVSSWSHHKLRIILPGSEIAIPKNGRWSVVHPGVSIVDKPVMFSDKIKIPFWG